MFVKTESVLFAEFALIKSALPSLVTSAAVTVPDIKSNPAGALVSRWILSQDATMQTAAKNEFGSEADYLAAEESCDIRHEFFVYTSNELLQEYALVAQSSREVTVFRRANGWRTETVTGLDANLTLNSLQLALPLVATYEGI